jgi:hypothetical protein
MRGGDQCGAGVSALRSSVPKRPLLSSPEFLRLAMEGHHNDVVWNLSEISARTVIRRAMVAEGLQMVLEQLAKPEVVYAISLDGTAIPDNLISCLSVRAPELERPRRPKKG